MAIRSKSGKRLIQSVARSLGILNCFERSDELQISEISAMVGIQKTTAHHLLATLREFQYIKQNPGTKGYSLGIQMFKLGYAYFNQLNLVKIARPHLVRLGKSTRETIHLAELAGTEVLYLDKIEGPMSITTRSRIGDTKPAYCTGLGKILLAFQGQERLEDILATLVLKRQTPNTIVRKSVLLDKLQGYRSAGYAIDDEEIEIGLFCIAAPIHDISGQLIAAISLSMPKYRIEGRLKRLISEVTRTAAHISRELGYSGQGAERQLP
jgi:DNA-binding IclR family transcriptional regulator